MTETSEPPSWVSTILSVLLQRRCLVYLAVSILIGLWFFA